MSNYFNHARKTICINTWRPKLEDVTSYDPSQWSVTATIKYRNCTSADLSLLDTIITQANWTEQIAHIFRILDVSDIWFNNMELILDDGLNIRTLIQQVSIHITELILMYVPTAVDFEHPEETLSKFINQFRNLRTLKIDYKSAKFAVPIMPVNQLEIVLHTINPHIQIDLRVMENHEDAMNTLGNSGLNISFTLFYEDILTVQGLHDVLSQFGNLENTDIMATTCVNVNNLVELQAFTNLSLQYDNIIELGLSLRLDTFGDEDMEPTKGLMDQLSSRINFLELRQQHKKWDVLNTPNCEYFYLIGLTIYGYEHPLEILKQCDQLQILRLDVDLESCIFSNPQQSFEENIKEYLSPLIRLNKLICHVSGGIAVMPPGTYLEDFLKGILPAKAIIKFRYPKPPGSEAEPVEESDHEDHIMDYCM